jgi:hypothetical protein
MGNPHNKGSTAGKVIEPSHGLLILITRPGYVNSLLWLMMVNGG